MRKQLRVKLRREQPAWPGGITALVVFLFACATLQLVRFYVRSATFYLDMPSYLAGTERIPFQERVLPIVILKPLYHWEALMHLSHHNGIFDAKLGPFYLLSLVSLAIAGIYTQRLYARLSRDGALSFLVYPMFLYTVTWSYVIHSEANYSYPYDFPGLAFFTAGLFYIYTRRFFQLLLVMLLGTVNRETTLFLIGIFMLDAASNAANGPWRQRLQIRLVPWQKVGWLAAVWLAVKLLLAYRFRFNDASEDFLRIGYNLHEMRPRLVPALLNMCGYLLPLVAVLWPLLRPRRFAMYLLILVPWVMVMFCTGVLVETRIYGELCSYTAIAFVLILERMARAPQSAAAVAPRHGRARSRTRLLPLKPAG